MWYFAENRKRSCFLMQVETVNKNIKNQE